jgi:Mg-chelatase subunit ChlD
MPSASFLRPLAHSCSLTPFLILAACSAAPESESATRETVTTREIAVGGIVSMRKETRVIEPIDAPRPEERQAQVQSGNLTAGDHDDLLNPELYAAYAGRFLQQHGDELPFVDTRHRVAVKVVDAAGRAVPHARIDVARRQGALHLVSAADGTASFYPRFDGVGNAARITVSSDAGSASQTLQLAPRGEQTAVLTLQGRAKPVAAMDLVLALDTTGSMGDEMAYLQAELESIVARLKRDAGNVDLRIGLIVYRDEGDDYVARSFPLTNDIGAMRAELAEQDAGGGGDMPEAVDRALLDAEQMQWRPDAVKAVLLVADAPPHEDAMPATLSATQRLRARGVQIVPVAASGVEDRAQYVMRTMAVLTQGRYIFLTDDSGVGEAHAEPDVACYVVTRLDQMIGRVLAGLMEGRRIEPDRQDIIRTVGDYDAGKCRGAQVASR